MGCEFISIPVFEKEGAGKFVKLLVEKPPHSPFLQSEMLIRSRWPERMRFDKNEIATDLKKRRLRAMGFERTKQIDGHFQNSRPSDVDSILWNNLS